MRMILPVLALFILSACNQKSEMSVSQAYAFATAASSQNGAVFLTIENTGADDRLLSAVTAAAERVEIHEMVLEDATMHMRQVDSITLPAGETISLSPKGHHLMLMNLAAPLAEGTPIDLTLFFAKAGEIPVQVAVMPPGQKPGAGANEVSSPDHGEHAHP